MSQESQPRASISSRDMGRKGAGVNLFAQKGLYEKMSFGSSEGLESGSLEGDGTTHLYTTRPTRSMAIFWGSLLARAPGRKEVAGNGRLPVEHHFARRARRDDGVAEPMAV